MASGWWSTRRVAMAISLALGWLFVLAHHSFRLSPSSVMLALAWLALVWTIQVVWAMADAAASPTDRASWWQQETRTQELMRRKGQLLRALKEIEFDRETGKLSQADADSLAASYRRDAIEVLRQLDAQGGASDASVHAQIEAEIARRRQVARATKTKATPS